MAGYWLIFGFFMIISLFVSNTLKSKFDKYSKERLASGLTGREIAEKMLRENGIHDVKVISVKGKLSDHYNPINKTINLSTPVYNSNSVAAAAVAAHECGHAVQHKVGYHWLMMRSRMVPVVQFGSKWGQWLLLIGLMLLGVSNLGFWILIAGIILFALTTLFAFITLPVEYNASARALQWLSETKITIGEEHEHAKDALKWAARTYLVAAISSLATLLYYIAIALRRRN